VYRLALEEGTRRVVVAGSNHAADWYEPAIHARRIDGIGPADLPKSDNYYGWAKIAYEALASLTRAAPLVASWTWFRYGLARRARSTPGSSRARSKATSDLGAYISARFAAIVRAIDRARAARRRVRRAVPDLLRRPEQYARVLEHCQCWRIIGYAPEDDSELRFAADVQRLLGASAGRVGD
jgi:hypothetical protein